MVIVGSTSEKRALASEYLVPGRWLKNAGLVNDMTKDLTLNGDNDEKKQTLEIILHPCHLRRTMGSENHPYEAA